MRPIDVKTIACLAILLFAIAGCDDDDPVQPVCGNGTREGTEECDDGDLLNGDGCSSTCRFDITGEFDLTASLGANPDFCSTGTDFALPISVLQLGSTASLTSGEIPGPTTLCARSDGTVAQGRFLGTGVTVYPDFFDVGCDLVESDEWDVTVDGVGDAAGGWAVTFFDDPADCATVGPPFPCTNEFTVFGSACVGCGPVCPMITGPGAPSTSWGRR